MQFDKIEEDLAKEIINIGLAKAADSLSFFTHEKVFIRSMDLHFQKLSDLDPLTHKKGDDTHVLITEIRGEMLGVCFLIFNKEEAESLCDISLPESVKKDSEKKKMMSEATLKEVDNIITAAVVTQFSNLLGVDIHGYVPILEVIHADKVKEAVFSHAKELDYVLNFTATFVSDHIDVAPEFLWILDTEFVDRVRHIIQDEEVMKKIELHKSNLST